MPDENKIRVFVSSAMDDVTAERQTVKTDVERLAATEFVGVELFPPASPISPRRRSIEQLQDCDVYIGIFGDRLGRITKEEYEAAVELGIPMLLFFRRPSALSDPKRIGERQRLEAFRAAITSPDNHTVRDFSTPDELSRDVLVSLNRLGADLQAEGKAGRWRDPARLASSSKAKPSKYLATLCDRNEQQPAAEELLENALAENRGLLVFAVTGPDVEEHHAFVEWYHYLRLRGEYTQTHSASDSSKRRDPIAVEWPDIQAPVEARLDLLIKNLALQLLPGAAVPRNRNERLAAITQALAASGQHVTLNHSIHSAKCLANDSELLGQWLDFWLNLKLPTEGHVTTVFFCLRDTPRLLSKLWPSSRHLEACLRVLRARESVHLKCLKPLNSPHRLDVVRWAEERCTRHYRELDVSVLKGKATELFARQENIPFAQVRPALQAALDHAHRAYGV